MLFSLLQLQRAARSASGRAGAQGGGSSTFIRMERYYRVVQGGALQLQEREQHDPPHPFGDWPGH
ncbi:hypothetical protein ABVD95_20050, partial [Xanthomonas euvesicatoria]